MTGSVSVREGKERAEAGKKLVAQEAAFPVLKGKSKGAGKKAALLRTSRSDFSQASVDSQQDNNKSFDSAQSRSPSPVKNTFSGKNVLITGEDEARSPLRRGIKEKSVRTGHASTRGDKREALKKSPKYKVWDKCTRMGVFGEKDEYMRKALIDPKIKKMTPFLPFIANGMKAGNKPNKHGPPLPGTYSVNHHGSKVVKTASQMLGGPGSSKERKSGPTLPTLLETNESSGTDVENTPADVDAAMPVPAVEASHAAIPDVNSSEPILDRKCAEGEAHGEDKNKYDDDEFDMATLGSDEEADAAAQKQVIVAADE